MLPRVPPNLGKSSLSHTAAAATLEAAAAAPAAAVPYTKGGGLTAEVGVRPIAVQLLSLSALIDLFSVG
jgi:hypothetical protein